MSIVIINPGTGAVSDATQENAEANVKKFIEDLGGSATIGDHIGDDGEGRWDYEITGPDGSPHEVSMPGLPIDQVRWLDWEDQDIWDFPRMYVDGSSWVWKFALNVCDEEEEDE